MPTTKEEENAAIKWQGRSFWLAVTFKPSSSILYVPYVTQCTYKRRVASEEYDAYTLVCAPGCFATLRRGTLSCQFVPGAAGRKYTAGRERGWKEKEEVRLVRHGGKGGGEVHLPPLLYILLLAVNSTDLHKETNAPPLCRSVIHSVPGKSRDQTHTHTESEGERDDLPDLLSLPLFRRRNFREGASEVRRDRERESLSLVSWTKCSTNLPGTRTMRNLNVT